MDLIPYMLVVGKKEAEAGNVAVRSWTEGRRGVMEFDVIKDEIIDHVRNRTLDVEVEISELAASSDEDEPEIEAPSY